MGITNCLKCPFTWWAGCFGPVDFLFIFITLLSSSVLDQNVTIHFLFPSFRSRLVIWIRRCGFYEIFLTSHGKVFGALQMICCRSFKCVTAFVNSGWYRNNVKFWNADGEYSKPSWGSDGQSTCNKNTYKKRLLMWTALKWQMFAWTVMEQVVFVWFNQQAVHW